MPVHTHRNDVVALHYLLHWLKKEKLELDWLRVNDDTICISVHQRHPLDPVVGTGHTFADAVRDLILASRGIKLRHRRRSSLTLITASPRTPRRL
jgi:hypothetical protein